MFEEGDKTEKPTDKRRRDALDKGNVAKSVDLSVGVRFIVAIFLFKSLMMPAWSNLETLTVGAWSHLPRDLDAVQANEMFRYYALQALMMMAPMLLGMLLIGLVTNVLQVGLHFNMGLLKFDLSRVNPLGPGGFKRFFSSQPYQQLLLGVAKMTVLGFIGYNIVARGYAQLLDTVHMDLAAAGSTYAALVWEVCWKVGFALLLIGFIDWILQKRRHEKGLRMSKQEIKDENKTQEGDPQVKGRRRQLAMQMLRKRMMQNIPKADVIITNPTHYAVAIQYDAKAMGAPSVVAKGADHLALKIRELAKEHKVPIVENPPLARALYAQVEIEQEIPPELYAAVSDVLVYVYRLSGKLNL